MSERLLKGIASIGKDELSFFADGVVYALEHPKIYMYDASAIPSPEEELAKELERHEVNEETDQQKSMV